MLRILGVFFFGFFYIYIHELDQNDNEIKLTIQFIKIHLSEIKITYIARVNRIKKSITDLETKKCITTSHGGHSLY